MNLIFVILCAIALFFYFDVVNPGRPPGMTAKAARNDTGVPSHRIISRFTFINSLNWQYDNLEEMIMRAWYKCNLTNYVSHIEAISLFVNGPWGDGGVDTEAGKCNVDCTLRETGMMTDDGFQHAKYIALIKQLRLNYTSYGMNVLNDNNMLMTSKSINRLLADQFTDDCFEITRDGRPSTGRVHNPEVCYELIQIYEMVTQKCKDLRDPKGNKCQTTWMIINCMMGMHRDNFFRSPFFPISPNISSALYIEAMKPTDKKTLFILYYLHALATRF